MKVADLRSKTADQLKEELLTLRKEQAGFRFQKATGQLESTGRIRTVRRDIARIKTVMTEQKSGAQPAASAKAPKKTAKAAGTAKKKKETKE